MSAPGKLTTLPAGASAAEIKEITDRDGAVIVEGVLSPELRERINAEVDPYLDRMDPVRDFGAEPGGAFMPATKRLEGLVEKSDTVVEVILDDRYQEWVAAALTWCTDFQFNVGQVIEIGPGEPAQILHRDESSWPQAEGGPNELMVTCIHAMTDFTEESGATRVVPGSHADLSIDPYSLDVERDSVPAVMAAGSALFYTGKVIHGGGANTTTDYRRRALALSCAVGWLKPEEAQTLAVSVERARSLPKRMRELCSFKGYYAFGAASPVCSHRLEVNDPYKILFGDS